MCAQQRRLPTFPTPWKAWKVNVNVGRPGIKPAVHIGSRKKSHATGGNEAWEADAERDL